MLFRSFIILLLFLLNSACGAEQQGPEEESHQLQTADGVFALGEFEIRPIVLSFAELETSISWSESANAEAYELKIGTDESCDPSLVEEERRFTTETTELFVFPDSGGYYICVIAISAQGANLDAINSPLAIEVKAGLLEQ